MRAITGRSVTSTSAARLKVLCLALATASAGVAAQGPIAWRAVAAGVEHAEVTREANARGVAGPWVIHLLRIDPSMARLDVVHARDNAVGLETVSSIAARTGAVAAVNGGYFQMQGTFAGDSTGTLQIDGTLLSEPDRGRAAVGFLRRGSTTALVMGHVRWDGTVTAGGRTRRLDGINRSRGQNELVLFTPGFSDTTLTDSSGLEVSVRAGHVEHVAHAAGSSPIPRDGYVLSATGSARGWAVANLREGTPVSVTTRLRPLDSARNNPWAAAEDVLGAGPMLVVNGRVNVTAKREKMRRGFDTERHPRTAVATTRDGRVLLVTVDGRQPEQSVGMSLDELARLLIEFGAEEAMNLDGGGSTTMVVAGQIVNHPSDVTGERPVSDALVVRPAR